ncbi:hypothetical protein J5X84_06160 [Streptosporangiaceae bacterium NEAU-GS5]|nr:hypothetical protein [Streptosporangiaceae bacterium NEAU-GS5]
MTAAAGVRTTVTVPERFRGPEGTANGGWIAGTLAGPASAGSCAVEVTLRRPVPLETELAAERVGNAVVLSLNGEHLAEAIPVAMNVSPPPFLPFADAARAEEGFAGYHARHWQAIAGCFACGQRSPGDGLRIFPGPVPGTDGLVAAGWRVPVNVTDDTGVVPDSIVWAALDCVTGWAHAPSGAFPASAQGARPALLGRLTAQVFGRVYPLGTYSVVGRACGRDGRKLYGESAVYESDGTLIAAARAIWILPR